VKPTQADERKKGTTNKPLEM